MLQSSSQHKAALTTNIIFFVSHNTQVQYYDLRLLQGCCTDRTTEW